MGPQVMIAAAFLASVAAGSPTFFDGPLRFTAVTNRLIRIEFDLDLRFVDEPTLTFLRAKPLGNWVASGNASHGWRVANTSSVSVRYQSVAPTRGSIVVTSRDNSSYRWSYGDDPEVGNLRGTARTLDSGAETLDLNCHNKVSPTMDNSEQHCVWGLASRSGWAVIDDTGAPLQREGWFHPSRNTTDISVFMHGLDYAGALKDYFIAAGPPALPPRYALGTMFTRWFNFDSESVKAIVEDFESRGMPLDAWIFDMNWHLYGPWGSFTWNKNSFPRLQKMLDWMKAQGLPIGANVHEHDGISHAEDTYKEVCTALGCTPGKDIPFDLYNQTYAAAQEDIAVRAISTKNGQQGIDFWWIDYQQGETNTFQKTTIPNINPTIVLNKIRSDGFAKDGDNRRSLIVSRWGGYGSHRYPVGFSGDQYHTWKGLAYLPYFTSTSANVAFNYWSHDTVGGDGDLAADYELSVRWVQTTAWSPVLRFHDKGAGTGNCAKTSACARVVPWDIPNDFFVAIRAAAQQREALLPYIYTAAWSTASTGLALVRPMYYENPADDALYNLEQQYLFGPDMVVSPITSPSGSEAQGFEHALGAVEWSVFAPKSAHGWVDRLNGDLFNGNRATSVYGIGDVPSLVRQGSVIPMRPRERGQSSLARAQKSFSDLEFRIMPAEAFYQGGQFSGKAQVVEDDGMTTDYLIGKQSFTKCEYSFNASSFQITLSQFGDFSGRPQLQTVRLSFPQLPPMTLVGGAVDLTSQEYNHELVGSILTFENVDISAGPTFQVEIDAEYLGAGLGHLVGLLGRVRRARYVKDALDDVNVNYGTNRTNLTSYVLAATQLEDDPTFVTGLPQLWAGATAEVKNLLATYDELKGDTRRSKFVSDMFGIKPSAADMFGIKPSAASTLNGVFV